MTKGFYASLLLLALVTIATAGCGKQTPADEPELAQKKLHEFYPGDNQNVVSPNALDGNYYMHNEDMKNAIQKLFESGDSGLGMEGYVVKKEDGRILAVDPAPKDFSSTGGMKEYHNAIWFSGAPENVQIGHKVRVWFNAVEDSFPGQSQAMKVLILSDAAADHSDLSEAEAIREALQALETEGFIVVKKAEYDEKSDTWNVLIRQGNTDLNAKVEDKT